MCTFIRKLTPTHGNVFVGKTSKLMSLSMTGLQLYRLYKVNVLSKQQVTLAVKTFWSGAKHHSGMDIVYNPVGVCQLS